MGLGGRSIAEWQATLTLDEVATWQAYITKRGSLNLGRRIEAGAALQGFMTNRAAGGKVKLLDLMPHEQHKAKTSGDDNAVFDAFKRMAKESKDSKPKMNADDAAMLAAFDNFKVR